MGRPTSCARSPRTVRVASSRTPSSTSRTARRRWLEASSERWWADARRLGMPRHLRSIAVHTSPLDFRLFASPLLGRGRPWQRSVARHSQGGEDARWSKAALALLSNRALSCRPVATERGGKEEQGYGEEDLEGESRRAEAEGSKARAEGAAGSGGRDGDMRSTVTRVPADC